MTQIVYHNEQGERIEREMNAAELAQLKKDKAESLALREMMKDKENARASAQVKLAALGLTDDEVKAIVGN